MKNKFSFPLPAMLTFFFSCAKHTGTPSTLPSGNLAQTLSGTWTITSYTQGNEDKTNTFEGYHFAFATGGMVKATQGRTLTEGTWVYRPAPVSYYDSTPSRTSFATSLGNNIPLSLLNRAWNIDSIKTTASVLALINPEPRDDERILFVKTKNG